MNLIIILSVLTAIMPILYEVNTILFVGAILTYLIIGFFWIFYE